MREKEKEIKTTATHTKENEEQKRPSPPVFTILKTFGRDKDYTFQYLMIRSQRKLVINA